MFITARTPARNRQYNATRHGRPCPTYGWPMSTLSPDVPLQGGVRCTIYDNADEHGKAESITARIQPQVSWSFKKEKQSTRMAWHYKLTCTSERRNQNLLCSMGQFSGKKTAEQTIGSQSRQTRIIYKRGPGRWPFTPLFETVDNSFSVDYNPQDARGLPLRGTDYFLHELLRR